MVVEYSWVGDGKLGDDGDPGGISEIAASIRLILSVRDGLKLSELIILLPEKMSDELEMMK